jgi:acetate kinase
MSASTGGVDVLVFTGGVGERSALVRRRAAEKLGFLGVDIDSHKNNTQGNSHGVDNQGDDSRNDSCDISATAATVRTMVIPAREDLQIAREARWLVGAG